jgi:hypothetical protein
MTAPATIPSPANLKPYEVFRYGMVFDGRVMNDFEIELYCYRIGRPKRLGGLGKFGHFKRFVDITWNDPAISPNVNFVWNDWSERMIKSAIRNKLAAWAGCASSGKSACAALFAIVEYLSDPMHTLVIVTSTTLSGARQRIWKSLDQYWRALPGLPGAMVPSIGRIKGANLDGKTFGDGTGIFLLASEKKKEKDALGKLIGIKAVDDIQNGKLVRPGRLILIADELPELPESLVHAAFTNLWANDGFKMIALGNPNSYFDAFGIVCKPRDGWDSVTEDDLEWATERGICLRFDSAVNPRVLGHAECSWMHSQEQIDQIARDYGERSVYYYRMVKGYWAPQGSVDALYAPSDILKFGTGKVIWGLRAPLRVAALDPAFSYGGDRSILYFGTYGESAEGLATLQFDDYVPLKEDLEKVRLGTPRSQQIVAMFREECEKRGIRPEHVAFDSTGAGPFGDMISAMWSNQVMRVNFAGKATSRPISPHDRTPASERYDNKMSELWAVGKSLLRAGQLKNFSNDLAKEMCQRSYETVKGGEGMRIRVESKPDYKARVGESPDIADAAFVLLELCRERFAFKSGERAPSVRPLVGPLRETASQSYAPPQSSWEQFVKRVNLEIPTLI